MNRKAMILVTSLALLVVVGWGIISATQSVGAANGNNQTALSGNRTPNPYPPGQPGISPRTNAQVGFTVTDVKQFINANGWAGGTVVPGSQVVIEKVLFVTSSQASQMIRSESIGRPDNAMVCYVQLYGPFGVSMDYPVGATPITSIPRVYEIFDAHTGNILVYGGLG